MNETHTAGITVEIERELEPIVPEFIDKRLKECLLIRQLLKDGAFTEIRIFGHRMKGTGGSYGFDPISEIGEVLEHAALAEDSGLILNEVQRLEDYLGRVTVIYV